MDNIEREIGRAEAYADVVRQGTDIFNNEKNDIQDRRAVRAFVDRFSRLTGRASVDPRLVEPRKSTELADAIRLAQRVLDEPGRDPDSDESVLARQLNRSLERETIQRNMIVGMAQLLLGLFDALPPELQDLPQATRGREIVARIIERTPTVVDDAMPVG